MDGVRASVFLPILLADSQPRMKVLLNGGNYE